VSGDTPVSLLEVADVEASYGPVRALHGISFQVQQGEVAALLGPNGAGKTTTLRAISGMVRMRGRIRFDGHSLPGRSTEAIARLGVAHVPEGRGNFPTLSVADNLRLGAIVRRDQSSVAEDLERCYQAFPRLAARRAQPAGSLSGGEQQMLAVARGLMLRPRLLLLDEPSLGLAPLVTRELYETLARLVREQSTTLLVVEQKANLVLEFADRAHVLEAGRIVLSGTAAEIRADEGMRRSYLGY
jgi:branched-chain amino acid transport system ATP-binding protein